VSAAVDEVFPAVQGLARILVDLRTLQDPAGGALCDHCGTHPEILQQIVAHAAWPGTVRDLAARLAAWRSGAIQGGAVVFVCNSGKHRSVAAATLLRRCLLEDADFTVPATHHVTHLASECRCGVCVDCDMSFQDPDRDAALLAAWRLWRRARTEQARR